MGRVIHKINFGVKVKVKRSLPLNLHILKIFNRNEIVEQFPQNDTKFVPFSQVVAEILRFEIWRVPSFFAKTPIFCGAYLRNYSSDFNKIENIGFFV